MTTWAIGEYPLMAARLEPAAQRLLEAAEIGRGDTVLDLATGTGNVALLAAAAGADVVGVDFEQALLDIAAERCRAAGLTARWVKADVGATTVADHWASAVLSAFGVMYASDHDAAAAELGRAVAPDGRIVLAAWVPGSFMPAMGPALAEFLPAPAAASGPPSRWGDAASLRELGAANGLAMTLHSVEELALDFVSVDRATEFMVRTAGHVIAEKARLMAEGRWDGLLSGVRDLIEARAIRTEHGIVLGLDYLVATLRPRAALDHGRPS